jgi:hypothetical protein
VKSPLAISARLAPDHFRATSRALAFRFRTASASGMPELAANGPEGERGSLGSQLLEICDDRIGPEKLSCSARELMHSWKGRRMTTGRRSWKME